MLKQMMPRGSSYFEKVWRDHVIFARDERTSLVHIDRLFLHELTGAPALHRLERSQRTPAIPTQVFAVIDHVIDTTPGRGVNQSLAKQGPAWISSTRLACAKYGITLFDANDPEQGIVHVIAPELGIALPGQTFVCGDSHTCTIGGVGAIAWGIGSTECETALATHALTQVQPKSMRITLDGTLPLGVHVKDLVLRLIGLVGARGALGHAVEFAGAGAKALSVEARLTLCNMGVEFAASYAFVPADDCTFEFLAGRRFAPRGANWDRAVADWRLLASDEYARFDRELSLDCSSTTPQVTWGTSPEHVVSVVDSVPDPSAAASEDARASMRRALAYMDLAPGRSMTQIDIDVAYIGSCTNGRLSDLRAAAQVLKGCKLAPHVVGLCVPGSSLVRREAEAEGLDRIFKDAGFEWHESGCGICGHMGNDRLSNRRIISTTNRNFENRQGVRARTHLASPATVAASAIAGHIADPRRTFAQGTR